MQAALPPTFDRDATSIRTMIPTKRGGYISTAGFPGLRLRAEGTPYIDRERLHETLVTLRNTGARRLLVLPEEAELPDGAFALVRAAAASLAIDVQFAAIADYSVPEAAFMAGWPQRKAAFLAALVAGETVALCCRHGAGRSGMIAALLLMGCGLPASEAIGLVRNHFDESIETQEQEDWLNGQN
ncbi:hypothetical protein SAMN04488523_10157 [Sulfitobacter brevis]|uniref:Tyrosine specific protein phosphatases domain-containing protein n=1 Tax=Sulfitobacter brevis TaxID=74348 RepID=A0A1I1SJC1_9RHOB|nr:hypothetical protein [Sulfitobacter brevis]SFD46536.1 hypothetical protein SAMN04488523_10157 [Sulfitobacter brevis]